MHNLHLLNYNELQLDENKKSLKKIEFTKNNVIRPSSKN